ncbi:PVC-type heme-binding CxxCH protein [Singulisphaera sp. PoT]|uniref:PVC-type heme-binding CxxCH protein n=1 Tax=Singulisphaera sp. PoT TaxID=3411797 RepID=UPI003BF51E75
MIATQQPTNPRPRSRTLSLAAFGLIAACASLMGPALGAEADPRLAGYRTPPGWKVEIAAAEPLVVNPVTMTFGDDGRLYVIEWKEGREFNDHIKVLTDTDGNGTFDKAEMYMDHLDLPAGILFWDGWTYLTLEHDVVRLKDKDGDGKFETREVIASGFGNDNSHHRVSGMSMGPDGWLYLTTGDSDAHAKGSDGSTATVLRCGGVFRCRPDGSKMENFAYGMRNPWGNVAFDDAFRVFHTDNDNEGSPGFTGCRILHAVNSGDYGWRLREGARCCAPDFERATWNGGRPGRLGWVTETGRGAPAGLCVLNSAAFPASTQNLLVYPDVFRKLVRAYKVKPAGATFELDREFELLASDEGLFRPTDAEVGPEGALYILDWRTDSGGAGRLSGNGQTGRIYRMTWAGTDAEPAVATLPRDRFVGLTKADEESLLKNLASNDEVLRRRTGLELIRRKPANLAKLSDLAKDEKAAPSARRHALAVVAAVDPIQAYPVYDAIIKGSDNDLKRLALENAARSANGKTPTVDLLPFFADFQGADALQKLAKIDPAVLRALVMYIGAERAHDKTLAIAKASNSPIDKLAAEFTKGINDYILLALAAENLEADAFLRDAFTRALELSDPDISETLSQTITSEDPKLRAAALFAVQGWRGSQGIATLVRLATSHEDIPAGARVGLFRALREQVTLVHPDRIAEWLRDTPKADGAARAEAIHVLTAMHQKAALAVAPILKGLVLDGDPAVRRAALVLASEIRSGAVKEALVALAKAGDRSAEERRLAITALRSYEDRGLVPLFGELFATSDDTPFRIELLQTLAALDFPSAATRAKALLLEKDEKLRQEAISVLGQKPETALAVAEQFNRGKLPSEDLSRVIEAVRPHATPEIQAAMETLLKKTVLAAPTGQEAARLRNYVERRGDPSRGKALYLDTKKTNCTTCHRLEGLGGAVGPDLTRIYETLSFDKRVESILDPSKEIKEGFGTFKVATKDGRVISGLLLSDTDEAVVLKDAQGREVKIPAAEVDEKGPDKTSLMPAGVVGHLSFNELADLLAFLGSRTAQESLRSENAGGR